MQFFTATVLAALGLSSAVMAAPAVDKRQGCSNFPWFIAPYADSQTCSGNPAYYQPTSGPYVAGATDSGCLPIYDPSGAPSGFQSVSINRDACPQQVWAIELYTETACGGEPMVVQADGCYASPGTDATSEWVSFRAIVLQN